MNLDRILLAVLFGLGTAGLLPSATAAPVTYYFSGTFEFQFGTAPAGLTGSNFSGTLMYDPAAVPESGTANSLLYGPGSGSLSVQTAFGSGAITAGTGRVRQQWDVLVATQLDGSFNPADTFEVGGTASYSGALSVFQLLNLQLVDGTGGVADDPFGAPLSALPTTLDLTQIDSASITLFAAGTVGGVFQTIASAVGRVGCLSTNQSDCSLSTVPEPGTLVLLGLGLGLAGLAATRRRRQ